MTVKKVMIVDDDRDLIEELQEALSLRGYEVVAISESTSALDTVFSLKPDVILLDLKMDGMSGFQIAQSLRRVPSTAPIPIIAMTGVLNKENHRALMEAYGITVCLEKPFNPYMVIDTIEAVLRKGA
ncbi:MAG: response regulator [bacterium]